MRECSVLRINTQGQTLFPNSGILVRIKKPPSAEQKEAIPKTNYSYPSSGREMILEKSVSATEPEIK